MNNTWLLSQLASVDSTLVLAVFLKGCVLLLVAGLVAGRLRAAAHRHLVWCLALAAHLVLPLAVLGPALPVAMPGLHGAGLVAEATERQVFPAEAGDAVHSPFGMAVAPSPSTVLLTAEGAGGGTGWRVIMAVWATGTVLLLVSLFRATVRRNRLLRHATPAGARWRTLLVQSADLLGAARLPDLLIGPRDAVPMTWGTLRPVVLLPGSVVEWPEGRCRDVLLHELSHVRRRDHLSQSMALLARALYWPNPLVWWAARRLRAESEQACDDLVLGAGARPSRYADHLLAAERALRATRTAAGLSAAGVGMAHRSQLAARIGNILDQGRSRTPLDRRRLLFGALATAAIVLPLAAAVPSPPARPDVPSPPARPEVPVPIVELAAPAALRPSPAASPEVRVAPPVPVAPPVVAPEIETPTVRPPAVRPEPVLARPEPAAAPGARPIASIPTAAASAAPSASSWPLPEVAGAARRSAPRMPAPAFAKPPLLEAVPKGRFSRTYVLEEDGGPVAELTVNRWKSRAELTIGETTYELYREGRLRGVFLLTRGGAILARAEKPSAFRRGYELHLGDSTYALRHPSPVRSRFVLTHGERQLGAIEPHSWHSRRARIALSEEWPLELRVFAFWLVELSWRQDDNQAVAAAGAVATQSH